MTPDAATALPDLLADYAPQPGVADELFDTHGQMRPVWTSFIAQLAALTPEEVHRRFARGEQFLRDAGVFFRLYSGGPAQEREWPLSHVPVLISEASSAETSTTGSAAFGRTDAGGTKGTIPSIPCSVSTVAKPNKNHPGQI